LSAKTRTFIDFLAGHLNTVPRKHNGVDGNAHLQPVSALRAVWDAA
jgi:hypothetical protein